MEYSTLYMMPLFKNQVLYYPYKLLKLNGRKTRRKGGREGELVEGKKEERKGRRKD